MEHCHLYDFALDIDTIRNSIQDRFPTFRLARMWGVLIGPMKFYTRLWPMPRSVYCIIVKIDDPRIVTGIYYELSIIHIRANFRLHSLETVIQSFIHSNCLISYFSIRGVGNSNYVMINIPCQWSIQLVLRLYVYYDI